MALASSSDLELLVAVAIAVAALTAAVCLLVAIAFLRAGRRWRHWRLAQRMERWRAALHEAMEDPAQARLPRIAALELAEFLMLWNHFQESLRGEAADNLARLLQRHGLHDRALRLLQRHSLRLRLIAITALGHLREERAWDALQEISLGPGPVTSFAAARALLRIEPRRALQVLAASLVERDDWSLARIGSIFSELGPDLVTPALENMLAAPRRQGLDRVVKLARFAHRHRIAPIVHHWLEASDESEVIGAALDYVDDSADLPWARGGGRHAEWQVRMAAARALGRIGGRPELPVLLELLRDPVWWVRYHAAQALTRLHGLAPGELESLRRDARDAFAADMLGQAMAETARQP